MWIIVSCSVLILIALIGLTIAIESFWLRILRPKADPPRFIIVFLKPDIALSQLRAASEELRWQGFKKYGKIIGVDCGLSKSELNILNNIYKNDKYVNIDDGTIKKGLFEDADGRT